MRPNRLVRPPPFVRIGQVPRLRPVHAAPVDAVRFLWLRRQVQRPHGTPGTTHDVANRWRADFLDPDSGWEAFPGISHASRHFDGGANFDEITFPTKGFSG